MQQFFIETIEKPYLSADQIHQCKNVLRMRVGDLIRLVDVRGQGAVVRIDTIAFDSFTIIETIEWKTKQKRLRLIASMIRSERLEWMIQKATECGVDEIVLYQSEHGVVRDFGKRTDRKIERFNTIAREASEQSYRQYPVSVKGPIALGDLENYRLDTTLYADIGNHPHIIEALTDDVKNLCVIVGPEGGFSDHERTVFNQQGLIPVGLGDNILRAETASLFICNMVAVSEVM